MGPDEFQGKTALITGAAGAIGGRLVERLTELGAAVYQSDITEMDVGNFTRGDISDPEFVTHWVDAIGRQADSMDILVNVAGICPRTAMTEITANEWDQVLQVNLRSAFLLCQAVIQKMNAQGNGAIVNLSSLAGKVGGIAVGAHYTATKAALVALTKTMARHGAPHGVRVNAVAPGIIDSAMTNSAGPDVVGQLAKSIPMGRLGSVDEVVAPILFLASDHASYITGATLDINGGILMD